MISTTLYTNDFTHVSQAINNVYFDSDYKSKEGFYKVYTAEKIVGRLSDIIDVVGKINIDYIVFKVGSVANIEPDFKSQDVMFTLKNVYGESGKIIDKKKFSDGKIIVYERSEDLDNIFEEMIKDMFVIPEMILQQSKEVKEEQKDNSDSDTSPMVYINTTADPEKKLNKYDLKKKKLNENNDIKNDEKLSKSLIYQTKIHNYGRLLNKNVIDCSKSMEVIMGFQEPCGICEKCLKRKKLNEYSEAFHAENKKEISRGGEFVSKKDVSIKDFRAPPDFSSLTGEHCSKKSELPKQLMSKDIDTIQKPTVDKSCPCEVYSSDSYLVCCDNCGKETCECSDDKLKDFVELLFGDNKKSSKTNQFKNLIQTLLGEKEEADDDLIVLIKKLRKDNKSLKSENEKLIKENQELKNKNKNLLSRILPREYEPEEIRFLPNPGKKNIPGSISLGDSNPILIGGYGGFLSEALLYSIDLNRIREDNDIINLINEIEPYDRQSYPPCVVIKYNSNDEDRLLKILKMKYPGSNLNKIQKNKPIFQPFDSIDSFTPFSHLSIRRRF